MATIWGVAKHFVLSFFTWEALRLVLFAMSLLALTDQVLRDHVSWFAPAIIWTCLRAQWKADMSK
jgi:hypothetical protein